MTTGRVLNGRYEVLELIGRGGMADVHLGRDLKLGRRVAIKLLRQDLARDPLFRSRFRREAQAVAGLSCPTIVAVYDTGDEEVLDRPEHEVRIPFIVMEYVPGRTLRDHVRSGELTPERSIAYLAGVLSALDHSHRAGIVHRDIKPANVMITPEDTVKVMDFGIARALADSQATMTQTQAVLGTAQYLSPEQALGQTVDARSDLYSAGCLLFELLTGRPPFVGDSAVSVAYQHVREEPPVASSIDASVTPALDSVLAKALTKDREHRFQDAPSFRAALLDAARGTVLADGAGTPTEALDVSAPATRAAAASVAGLPGRDLRTTAMDRVVAEDPAPDVFDAPDAFDGVSDDDLDHLDGTDDTDDMEDARNGREDRRRLSRAAWITVLLAAVLIVLGTGFFVIGDLGSDPGTEAVPEVVVPDDLVGMEVEEASDAVTDAGLRASSDQDYHDSVDAGLVISTDPSSGASVPPDSRVNLLVSRGPANVTVPASLEGMTEASARDALERAGLRTGRVSQESSATVAAGQVLRTSPQLGESAPADSAVDLVLSTGRVVVPLLTDLTQQEAEARLADQAVGLPSRIVFSDNSVVEPGIVTAQSVRARDEVDQGTEIVLTVAVAPPAPEPEPEPEQPEPEQPETRAPAPETPGPVESAQPRPSSSPAPGPGDGSEGRPTTGPDEAGDDGTEDD
ncbi:Stk1 family PASTA domain-containing Ser/Thr kinase [Arthrobacter sp. RIT-PI-e]|uniref:Stk1 family PASTA domain-containing Ser/Thr kinase n=1 Tax=Arthrobacter sp. RIT-PI-e TaxID=1681197 RepID=UPI0009E19DE7|nr:Stk1 family PASTA domain-containing Ser/Thr kinase [Arthrobacter sp. RIT-PI-e]